MSAESKVHSERLDNYLKAYSKAQAIAVRSDLVPSAQSCCPLTPGDLAGEGALPSSARSTGHVARAELGIRYNGRSYEYRGYHYDRLADAVSYAKLDRARALAEPAIADPAPFEALHSPTSTERQLMRELDITFQDGIYRLGDYRYDRMADAIAYARLTLPKLAAR